MLHDGWFLTGDLAHRDSGGRIVLDGRTSSVIHVAGHKVFPEEVAAVLDQHPAVLRSRVFGRPHPQMGEAIHAEVQLRNGFQPTARAKKSWPFAANGFRAKKCRYRSNLSPKSA